MGRFTLPVYEIYKVGEELRWEPGIDIMSRFGLNLVVVPHWNNAEGGTHDTRFCYMGERRLRVLETTLPEDAFILGVDSHTALLLDLDSGTATVSGLGGVTVRAAGRSAVFGAGRIGRIEGSGPTGPGVQRSERQLRKLMGIPINDGTLLRPVDELTNVWKLSPCPSSCSTTVTRSTCAPCATWRR